MISLIGYIVMLILPLTGKSIHPVHVGILNVDYNSTRSTLDLSLKVYTADLELAIGHNYNIALNLGKSTEIATSNVQIQKYLTSTLSCTINNQVYKNISIQKKEYDGDAIRLYFSVPFKGKLKILNVKAMVLMDVFEDQTNLVIIVLNGKEQGYRQTYGSKEISVKN